MVPDEINKRHLADRVAEIVNWLPPIPENIENILGVYRDAAPSCADAVIKDAATHDPGLAADVMHLAKIVYRDAAEIETIDQAIECIGVDPVIHLIRACYARHTLWNHFSHLKNLNQYGVHSQQISDSCRILADVTDITPLDRGLYVTAGLLHDIGRLVILLASNRFNAPLLGTTADKLDSIDHDEKCVLGLSHCQVGWQICKKWDFSPLVQEAVLRHHTPMKNGCFSVPGAFIFVAHFVSFSDVSGDIISKVLPAELLAGIHLTSEGFFQARKRLLSEHSEFQDN